MLLNHFHSGIAQLIIILAVISFNTPLLLVLLVGMSVLLVSNHISSVFSVVCNSDN